MAELSKYVATLLVLFLVSLPRFKLLLLDDWLPFNLIFSFQTSAAFWMPVQYINFFVVPTSMRVIFIAATSFLWVNLLCVLKRQENQPQIVEIN